MLILDYQIVNVNEIEKIIRLMKMFVQIQKKSVILTVDFVVYKRYFQLKKLIFSKICKTSPRK